MARILDFADGFTSSLEPTLTGIPASHITFSPDAGLVGINVQAAIVELATKRGQANGLAALDANGKVPIEQVPAIAITSVHVVADISARDELEVEEGDVALVDDDGDGNQATYIFDGSVWKIMESDAALALHAAATATHGVSGAIVGTSDAQVLTNKFLNGGVASNSRVWLVPKETRENIESLDRVEASLTYATDQKKLILDLGDKVIPVGSGGGGAGGGITWIEEANAPLYSYEFGRKVAEFAAGLEQVLICAVDVPLGYSAGAQLVMRVKLVSASTTGDINFKTLATLIRTDVDLISSTSNQRTSTNDPFTTGAGTASKPTILAFDLTSSDGEINGEAVSPGDTILVELRRQISGDTSTDTAKILLNSTEVSEV